MRSVLTMSDDQMTEWNNICKEFCKQNGFKLLFVNHTSFGYELPNGDLKHVYVGELEEMLK